MNKKNARIQFPLLIAIIMILLIPCSNYANISYTVPSEGAKSINQAVTKAKFGDTIWVKPGVYKEHISLTSGITLISSELHKAVIDGKGRGDVVKISYNSSIIGFEIRNGNVGVVARGQGTSIQKCKIYKNRISGIICMGNLPILENNIIAYNEGSGIQAVDIISSTATINHNTIAYNRNNGIVISGTSTVIIENNIIVSNSGQGIKTGLELDKVKITHNDLFANRQFKFSLPENNFTFDPLFTAPKRKTMDFGLQPESPAIKRGNDNRNLGALLY